MAVLKYSLSAFTTLLCTSTFFVACGEDDVADPVAEKPAAAFSLNNSTARLEGDSIFTTNSSTKAKSYQWSVRPGSVTSAEKEPIFEMLDEGTYTIQLIAIGDGGADTTEQTVTIGVNREFRAFGYGAKTWYVHSLKVNGNETADDPCYWDNTLNVDQQNQTFSYKEGTTFCPNPVLPEQEGTFTYDTDLTTLNLAITDPFTSNVVYTIDHLTRDSVRLSASLSSSNVEFIVSTTLRTK
ncbi:MAG: hypothetical protein KDD67_06955 [Ignavibacteriae bacterium]|nr:hypothetical protein [Ignavibacteriota bacterium]MCB9215215.1 hypothetical protein [Ignavibacteria bacterium]